MQNGCSHRHHKTSTHVVLCHNSYHVTHGKFHMILSQQHYIMHMTSWLTAQWLIFMFAAWKCFPWHCTHCRPLEVKHSVDFHKLIDFAQILLNVLCILSFSGYIYIFLKCNEQLIITLVYLFYGRACKSKTCLLGCSILYCHYFSINKQIFHRIHMLRWWKMKTTSVDCCF